MATDAQLAALASRALHVRDGSTAEDAIVLDDDIADAPLKPRSDRPRVQSIKRAGVREGEALAALRSRGLTRAAAAGDGNCAQRSACVGAGRMSCAEAKSSDARTMASIRAQRGRIVDRLLSDGEAQPADAAGPSVGLDELRSGLQLGAGALDAFRREGHWLDTGAAFTAFLWGLADDLGVPLVVLHRSRGAYDDPVCVYRAQQPGGGARRRENHGAFAYVPFAELLRWLDGAEEWPPPLALCDFVPGHYSPFVYARERPARTG